MQLPFALPAPSAAKLQRLVACSLQKVRTVQQVAADLRKLERLCTNEQIRLEDVTSFYLLPTDVSEIKEILQCSETAAFYYSIVLNTDQLKGHPNKRALLVIARAHPEHKDDDPKILTNFLSCFDKFVPLMLNFPQSEHLTPAIDLLDIFKGNDLEVVHAAARVLTPETRKAEAKSSTSEGLERTLQAVDAALNQLQVVSVSAMDARRIIQPTLTEILLKVSRISESPSLFQKMEKEAAEMERTSLCTTNFRVTRKSRDKEIAEICEISIRSVEEDMEFGYGILEFDNEMAVMVSPCEMKVFESLMHTIDPNPRKLKRIVNIYQVIITVPFHTEHYMPC